MNQDAFGCVANTIRLRSGLYFDLADPKPNQFTFADIAGALSKLCRFGGQINCFYSVAEHSVHCAGVAFNDGLPLKIQQALLLHDAAEAFAGDVVKPLKIMLRDYSVIERRIERVITDKYGVDFDAPEVREIDCAMLLAERRAMFSPDAVKWTGEDAARRLDIHFAKWNPAQAEEQFMACARAFGLLVKGAAA